MSEQNTADLPGDFQNADDTDGGVAVAEQNGADETPAADAVPIGELTVQAPDGAEFTWSEVKTNRGQQSLGQVPILRWTDPSKAQAFYGPESFLDALNDTGLRVPFQSIARRLRVSGKGDANAIAQEQIDYRPGSRQPAQSTAASRAKSAAARAAEALGDQGSDLLTTLLGKIARGELSQEQVAAMLGQ